MEIRAVSDNSLSRKNQSPSKCLCVCVAGFLDWMLVCFGFFPPSNLLRGLSPTQSRSIAQPGAAGWRVCSLLLALPAHLADRVLRGCIFSSGGLQGSVAKKRMESQRDCDPWMNGTTALGWRKMSWFRLYMISLVHFANQQRALDANLSPVSSAAFKHEVSKRADSFPFESKPLSKFSSGKVACQEC